MTGISTLAMDRASSRELLKTEGLSTSQSARALIIDDDPDLADTVADILHFLADTTLETSIAHSGAEGIARAEQLKDSLDVAIVDLRLPDRDGLELLGDLRRLAPTAEFLILTGDLSVGSAVAAVDARVFAYVLKPFRQEELLRVVRNALDQVALRRKTVRLQHELEQSERNHRELVEAIPAFVLALDYEGKILFWNKRLEELTGLSRTEMEGTDGREYVGSGGDRRVRVQGGGHRLVRWQCTDLPSANHGWVTYALGIDVSDEHETLRRTLQQERNAAVGTLGGGLAHEIRNPLNGATLQLQVLRRRIERGKGSAEDLLPVVAEVQVEISRVERLLHDFLAFAQPMRLDLKSVSLNDLLAELCASTRARAERSRVDIACKLNPEIGPVKLEPERMRRAFANLFENAIDAMPEGGTLSVRTQPADTAGFVHVEVEDTGTGFASGAPIFDAFYTTKTGGTGLGLALVHRIVNEHGGVVRAETRESGALFTVLLPQPLKP